MIHEYLAEGAANARSAKELCAMLSLSGRELSLAVEKERRAGYPICSSTDHNCPGYFLAANRGEMERFCNSLYHRAGEIHKTRKACLKTLEKL